MKKYLIFIFILSTVFLTLWIQHTKIKDLMRDRDKYRSNTEVLLGDIERYRTENDLKAASVGTLRLKISEFERLRSEDADLIKSLQVKNRSLQAVTSAQMETINELRGNVRDSVIYLKGDTVKEILHCVDITDKWYEFHGCLDDSGNFSGKHINREDIAIAATVKYKRFLGFLWKTRKVKDRKIDAVSRNPATSITNIEYIEIED